MSTRAESYERPRRSEITPIMMSDTTIIDLPHIPILWGAFNLDLLLRNREKLLRLHNSVPQHLLDPLSDYDMSRVYPFLERPEDWTEVRGNIVDALGISAPNDFSRQIYPDQFRSELKKKLTNTTGNAVLMGTSHSILYYTHQLLREESADRHMRVAEIVLDNHIDTVVNPGVRHVTSGNFYKHLTDERYLEAPIIFGPEGGLIDTYRRRGEDKKISRVMVLDQDLVNPREFDDVVPQVLEVLKKWGVTNVTFSVDLDVLSLEEGGGSVRYSPLNPYLGLGCQELPDSVTSKDIQALQYLLYPTPKLRYFLQKDKILDSQDPTRVRREMQTLGHSPRIGRAAFDNEALQTDMRNTSGIAVRDGVALISDIKNRLSQYNIFPGIPLKSGGVFSGSVVEMAGFEDYSRRTTDAALQFTEVIGS